MLFLFILLLANTTTVETIHKHKIEDCKYQVHIAIRFALLLTADSDTIQ
jgi:hypothetical protein